MTISLTLCLLSTFLLKSIKCEGEIELKCYNGLLEKRCHYLQGCGNIHCQIPCKSMLIHEGGGLGVTSISALRLLEYFCWA